MVPVAAELRGKVCEARTFPLRAMMLGMHVHPLVSIHAGGIRHVPASVVFGGWEVRAMKHGSQNARLLSLVGV